MFRLFEFLYNSRNTLLFIVLELVALLLIIRYNDHQRHVVGDNLLESTAWVSRRRAGVKKYFHLGKEQEKLMLENRRLRAQLYYYKKKVNYIQNEELSDSLQQYRVKDTLKVAESFDYIPVNAIRNSTIKDYNYITLDKGSLDGIMPGMGVISPDGIAGRVVRVSKNYSIVLSVLNLSFSLSAKISGQEVIGHFTWRGVKEGTGIGFLSNLPMEVNIKPGDKVVTSGYSTVFPEGFIIGEVDSAIPGEEGFQEIKVQLATDFHGLGTLYAVVAEHKTTLDSLHQGLPGVGGDP